MPDVRTLFPSFSFYLSVENDDLAHSDVEWQRKNRNRARCYLSLFVSLIDPGDILMGNRMVVGARKGGKGFLGDVADWTFS